MTSESWRDGLVHLGPDWVLDEDGVPVGEDFEYNSDNKRWLLGKDELAALLRECAQV